MAEVYRSVDAYGNVSYSDEPSSGAETIEIDDAPVLSGGPVDYGVVNEVFEAESEPELSGSEEELAVPSYQLKVVSPQSGEAIRVNSGNIEISVSVAPALDGEREDTLKLYLDGVLKVKGQTSTTFSLSQVDRGAHTVRIDLIDKSGKVLSSASSAFQLHRYSVQHNKAN